MCIRDTYFKEVDSQPDDNFCNFLFVNTLSVDDIIDWLVHLPQQQQLQ